MMRSVVHPVARPRHFGWISRAIASGFLASIAALLVMLAAYGFAYAVGTTSPNANVFSHAMWSLTHNSLTQLVANVRVVQAAGLHMAIGLVWAVVYAALVEPVVAGPGWRKGLFFAAVPCLISIFVFLPLVGVGVFGLSVGAGLLPGLGVVLLHVIYGGVLGETYALADGEGMLGGSDNPYARLLTLVERDLSIGIALGAIVGAVISLILAIVFTSSATAGDRVLTIVSGAVEGAFTGAVIGVLVGLITSDGVRMEMVRGEHGGPPDA